MKRIFTLIVCILLISGCGFKKEDKAINAFKNGVNDSKNYTINGSLDIYNDEDSFNYNLEIGYKKKDMYRVKLTNSVNNHVQIILKNNDGVYVITPELNKSFKFESDWPNNSSQAYLLESIVNDLNNTKEKKLTQDGDNYVVKTIVNYPNNSDLSYQMLTIDKNGTLLKNEVYNSSDKLRIKVTFDEINLKANLDDNYFALTNAVNGDCCKVDDTKPSSNELNDIIYPLYIPSDTYLSNKETISTDNGNRAILTFSGGKDFVLIEEASTVNAELETIPIYGDPVMLNGMVGALSKNSLYWTNNNIDYYLAGNDMSTEELLNVASSISNTIVTGK